MPVFSWCLHRADHRQVVLKRYDTSVCCALLFSRDVDCERLFFFPLRRKSKNMQIDGKKELALALVLCSCLYDLTWLKIKIRDCLLQAFVVSSEIWAETKKQQKSKSRHPHWRAIKYLIYSQSIKRSLSRWFLKTSFHFLVKLFQFLIII